MNEGAALHRRRDQRHAIRAAQEKSQRLEGENIALRAEVERFAIDLRRANRLAAHLEAENARIRQTLEDQEFRLLDAAAESSRLTLSWLEGERMVS